MRLIGFISLLFFLLCAAESANAHGEFISVIANAKPSVVVIEVSRSKKWFKSSGVNSRREALGDYTDFFEADSKNMPKKSRGSGFVVNSASTTDGLLVLTASHVVKGAKKLFITFENDERYPAKILWLNQKNDLAVLVVAYENHALNKGLVLSENEVVEGQPVLAIGSAFSLSMSSSQGIISAKDVVLSDGKKQKLLQTDAAINPGFSGGPLLDEQGRVVGLITNIYSKTGTFSGTAFAVPSIKIVELLAKNGIQ